MFAQSSSIGITLHARVDTTQQEIKAISQLWINYLLSRPDSIYDHPCWNSAEKKTYRDFDFTRQFLYPFPSKQLLSYYAPTVLSIEKEGAYYAIRTLFQADGLEGVYRASNPWCITKIYAIKEQHQWKLMNALPVVTKHWKRTTVGKITFIYPPEHSFNLPLAKRANRFCDSLAKRYGNGEWSPFDYYITTSGDALGRLLGFDFYYTGYSTGMTMKERSMIFTGCGTEWYPHEFVHWVVGNKQRHGLVEEGFATWVSGQVSNETSFKQAVQKLAVALSKNDTVTVQDIIDKKWGWQNASLYFYATGAVFCQLVYDKKGLEGLQQLLALPADKAVLLNQLCTLLDVTPAELLPLLRKQVNKYRNTD